MKFTFAHNNFNVIDLDKSLKFYEEALGLKEVRRKEAADVFQAPPARQSEYSPDPACGSPRGSRAASSCRIHFRRQSRCIPLDLPQKRHFLGSSFRGTVFLSLLPLTYFSSL